jgi:putative transposase
MRFPRVKAEGRSFYHCISRFVHGLFIFGTSGGRCAEAEEFLSLMRRWAAFCGIRILDYVLMANHFHILCDVPEPKPLTQNELLERIKAGYGPERVQALREQLVRFAQQPDGVEQSKRVLEPYLRQMNDLSIFMKKLKGCFAQQYNRRHKRHGTLWSERFKSVLLEGGTAVAAIAAYIDLNPVRAGLWAFRKTASPDLRLVERSPVGLSTPRPSDSPEVETGEASSFRASFSDLSPWNRRTDR